MTDFSGKIIERYEIIDQLGEGGMASVYRGRDLRLQREVAVKFIRTEMFPPVQLQTVLKRFEREAQILAGLNHPNIVHIYDFGDYEHVPYVVMEYLSGGTLRQRIGSPLNYRQAARLLTPIANALEYAHHENVIHRDIKPANILISHDGVPKISDFGVAKLLGLEEGVTLTGTGIGIGTPAYMAPEQWLGKTSPAVDIYALGVVFYELLTGDTPYHADTPGELLMKIMSQPLPDLHAVIPDLPQPVIALLGRALAKQPEDRYHSMAEMAGALKSLEYETSPSAATAIQAEPELEKLNFETMVDYRVPDLPGDGCRWYR
jgi:eukaryotic-like serine/threonine-protein kinase